MNNRLLFRKDWCSQDYGTKYGGGGEGVVVSRNAHAKLVRNEVEVSTIAGVALPYRILYNVLVLLVMKASNEIDEITAETK